jgi:hypothetical protein
LTKPFDWMQQRSNCDVFLLNNGCDHHPPQREFGSILEALREAFPDVEFVHGKLGDYVAAVRESGAAKKTYEGELLGGRYHHILSGVWSARMKLKQQNDSAQTLLAGYVYDKQPLADGGTVTSGERVEVVVTVEAKNDYEYLVFEDLKPAGLEAVEVRSGQSIYIRELKSGAVEQLDRPREPGDYTGRQRWVYQELRDRKVALFVDKLPQGVWEIRYELRAEVPGSFHALPVLGHAMYVPEIRCNGKEIRITVLDRE